MTAVAAALVDAYRQEGHCSVPGVLDAADVAAAVDHLGRLAAAAPAGLALVTAPLAGDGFLARTAADPRLTGIASVLLGGAATAFGCTYVVKPPRVGLPALWHQDGHPWRTGLGIAEAVTLWIALDLCDAGNGCLRVVPGTHRVPARPLRPSLDRPNLFGCELDEPGVDTSRAVDVELAPGDLSAHHPDLVHGSSANLSGRPRRALVVRYRTGG